MSLKKISLFLFAFLALTAFSACSVLTDAVGGDSSGGSSSSQISKMTLSRSSGTMSVGDYDNLTITISPSSAQQSARILWEYDHSIIELVQSSNYGVVIKGLKEGQTFLTASCDGITATYIVTVSGFADNIEVAEPYITSSQQIMKLAVGGSSDLSVSLYGGTVSDNQGFAFDIENGAVASIHAEGNACFVSAATNATNYTRIKVTHPKAAYPHYVGVYVYSDPESATYITTKANIVSMQMNGEEESISVSLVNPMSDNYSSQFKWSLVKEDGYDDIPVSLQWNGEKGIVTPIDGKSGICKIVVEHPDAATPLYIMCRVIKVVKNVYIEPETTIMHLVGEDPQTLSSTLQNVSGPYDLSAFSYSIDNLNAAEIVNSSENMVMVKGTANGSCKLIISHPSAKYSREVLLLVSGQMSDAVDSSCYITTSQNYIRTKVGADEIQLRVSLKGGEDGDESNFIWTVANSPDEIGKEVIKLETANGSVSSFMSRSASPNYIMANAVITPVSEGTAVITVTNPRVLYPTEILVKVLNKDAQLDDPLYLSGEGIVRVLNGNEANYHVSLSGNGYVSSADEKINWSVNNSKFSLTAAGKNAVIRAPTPGSGNTIGAMTVSHPQADAPKTVALLSADTEEELNAIKCFYSDKQYYNIMVGDKTSVQLLTAGFTKKAPLLDENGAEAFDENGDPIFIETMDDFSTLNWKIGNAAAIEIERNKDYPLICAVKGLAAGSGSLTASYTDENGRSYSYTFYITVYPQGTLNLPKEYFFTTMDNVVNLSGKGKSKDISVSINLSASEQTGITWEAEDASVATVKANGQRATITAVSDGETVVKVSHPKSQNTLKIYVRVGDEYVIPEANPAVYVAAQDIVTILVDEAQAVPVQAALVNYSGGNNTFGFLIDDASVARISASDKNTGKVYLMPVDSGQCVLTITSSVTENSKQVLVLVGTEEELASFKYLTTSQNVVNVGEANKKTISVSVANSSQAVLTGYNWTSGNKAIASIESYSANTAVIKGNSQGTTTLTVTNAECKYPLSIIVNVVNPIAAAASPYIQLSKDVMILTAGTAGWTEVTADLVGGADEDNANFVWSSNNSQICSAFGNGATVKLKPLSAGTTYINCKNSAASCPAQLLVVVEEATGANYSISVSPSSVITMAPTDAYKTITATLVNGDANSKYNFQWTNDNPTVISADFTANVCKITPVSTGTATLTIHHPYSPYDQQVLVTVQEYNTFAFPSNYCAITQGESKFLSMQVPVTNVRTMVQYSVKDQSVVKAEGTKSVCELTGLNVGSTTVYAKLLTTSTGAVQAEAEMLVRVNEADSSAVYITGTNIYSITKGKSQTISASVYGAEITATDEQDLRWSTNDTDVIGIAGVSADGTVTGKSVYVTAKQSGEAVINVSHKKAQNTFQIYVIVPGSAAKSVSLNKSYMVLTKGASASTVTATISNIESADEYNDLVWTADKTDGREIVRIMESGGQTVHIKPVSVGTCVIKCQIPNSGSVAKCTVEVEADNSFAFDTKSVTVSPAGANQIAKVKYTVSPVDAVLKWVSGDASLFDYMDLGCDDDGNGEVEIIGQKLGNTTLSCVTNKGASGQMTVKCDWAYQFSISGATSFSIEPDEARTVSFLVNPPDADISVSSTENCFQYEIERQDGGGQIVITPLEEHPAPFAIEIKATNPNNGNETVGTEKAISCSFKYKTLTPAFGELRTNGSFSRVEEDDSAILYVGDGETVSVDLSFKEPKANVQLKSVEIIQDSNSDGISLISQPVKDGDKIIELTLSGGSDEIDTVATVIQSNTIAINGKQISHEEMTRLTTMKRVNVNSSGGFDKYPSLKVRYANHANNSTQTYSYHPQYEHGTKTNVTLTGSIIYSQAQYNSYSGEIEVIEVDGTVVAWRSVSLRNQWYCPEGSVTFNGGGFVSTSRPSARGGVDDCGSTKWVGIHDAAVSQGGITINPPTEQFTTMVENTMLGKTVPMNELLEFPWYYFPPIEDYEGEPEDNIDKFTRNDMAITVDDNHPTTSTEIKSTVPIYMKLNYIWNGQNKVQTILIRKETRGCPYKQ